MDQLAKYLEAKIEHHTNRKDETPIGDEYNYGFQRGMVMAFQLALEQLAKEPLQPISLNALRDNHV